MLFELERLDESRASWLRALACYDRLIGIKPDDAEVLRDQRLVVAERAVSPRGRRAGVQLQVEDPLLLPAQQGQDAVRRQPGERLGG